MAEVDDKGTGPLHALLPGLPPGKGWETWAWRKADESPSLQVSEAGTRERARQPENKPLNHLMLLITGKHKTPFIYHQTLLSRGHFHILAVTFSRSKEYSFAYQPVLHQTDSTGCSFRRSGWV